MSGEPDALRIAGFIRESIVDGPGLRFVVFAQGCPHRCKGCHNPETHDFEKGQKESIEKLAEEVVKNPLLSGVTFSGGEPFVQPEGFYRLGLKIKEKNPEMNIIIYSGYTYEELLDLGKSSKSIENLLAIGDYLVDGRFLQEQRDLTLRFRGSTNQRFIDLNKTRREGRPITDE